MGDFLVSDDNRNIPSSARPFGVKRAGVREVVAAGVVEGSRLPGNRQVGTTRLEGPPF